MIKPWVGPDFVRWQRYWFKK